MQPYYEQDGITIYHGDCRDMVPDLAGYVLITDPPYGIGFNGKVTKHTDNRGLESYVDTYENFLTVVLPIVRVGIEHSQRAAIFSGIPRMREYPPPQDIGGIICPNGGGRSSWGFRCYHPVLFYGRSPYMAHGLGGRPTAVCLYHPGMHVTGENNGHPCPKPLAFMVWAVNIASLSGERVFDPFMGSGTTLVAAKQLGRKAIGIDIEERYCEIAAHRLQQSVLPFPSPARPVMEQSTLLG